MIKSNINKLVTEWKNRTFILEKLIFKELVGKFITHNDIKCTAIFYVHDIDVDGLLISTINNLDPECGDNYVRFGSNVLKLSEISNYKILDKEYVIGKFSKRLIGLFKTLTKIIE